MDNYDIQPTDIQCEAWVSSVLADRLRRILDYISEVPHPWLSLAWAPNNGSWIPISPASHYIERNHTAEPMRILVTGHFVHYHAWPTSVANHRRASVTIDLLTDRDCKAAAHVYDSGRFSARECAEPGSPPQMTIRALVAPNTPILH